MAGLSVILVACHGRRPAVETPKSAPLPIERESEPPAEATIPILEGEGETGWVPIIAVDVAGIETFAFVDTGAPSTVVSQQLIAPLGLNLGKATKGGAAGDLPVSLRRHDAQIVSVGPWGLLGAPGLHALPLPQPFVDAGIGAIVSPMDLSDHASAVLIDLPNRRLFRKPYFEAGRWLQRSGPQLTPDWIQGCNDAGWELPNTMFVVPATVSGVATTLLVDTGAASSSVHRDSELGGQLLEHGALTMGQGLGAGGVHELLVASAVQVAIGGQSWTVDIDLQNEVSAEPPCPSEGNVGMDILQHCRLMLTTRTLGISCDPVAGDGTDQSEQPIDAEPPDGATTRSLPPG